MLNRVGEPESAEVRLREALAELRSVFPENSFQVAFAASLLGANLAQQGRFEDAEALLLPSHETILDTLEDPTRFYAIDSFRRVLELYDRWQRPADAAPYRRQLADITARAKLPTGWAWGQWILGPELADVGVDLGRLADCCGRFGATAVAGDLADDDQANLAVQAMSELRRRLPSTDPRILSIARQMVGWSHAMVPELRRRLVHAAWPVLEDAADSLPYDSAEAAAVLAAEAFEVGDAERSAALVDIVDSWVPRGRESDHWLHASAKARIARELIDAAEPTLARELLVEARDTLEIQLGATSPDLEEANRLLEVIATAEGSY